MVLHSKVSPSLLVWADPEKIHQVLVNLLTNALAATGTDGRVTVTAAIRPASGMNASAPACTGRSDLETVVTLVVSDSGCGMPRDDVERCLSAMARLKRSGRGTGLGLFLSRRRSLPMAEI